MSTLETLSLITWETGPVNLFRTLLQAGGSAHQYLMEHVVLLDSGLSNGGRKWLGELYLPWYKPNRFGEEDWAIPSCQPYKVNEYKIKNDKVERFVHAWSEGNIISPVTVVVAGSIIVDGSHRALAVHKFWQHKDMTIRLIQIHSPILARLLPCEALHGVFD